MVPARRRFDNAGPLPQNQIIERRALMNDIGTSASTKSSPGLGAEFYPVPGDTEILSDCLASVARVAPVIRDLAPQAEADRQLPGPLLAALHGEKLFRLLLPAAFGGAEVSPPVFAQTIEAVARLDGSTAWCLCQGNGCAMAAAYAEPEVARKIWGEDPRAVLAWGPGRRVSTVPEAGGYRVTAHWSFASGGRHATWLGGHTLIKEADGSQRRNPDGSLATRTLLMPRDAVEFHSVWNVIGLLGTGSDDYSVEDLFVPEDHLIAFDQPFARRQDGPLYLFSGMNLYAAGFAATAIGDCAKYAARFPDAGGWKDATSGEAGTERPRYDAGRAGLGLGPVGGRARFAAQRISRYLAKRLSRSGVDHRPAGADPVGGDPRDPRSQGRGRYRLRFGGGDGNLRRSALRAPLPRYPYRNPAVTGTPRPSSDRRRLSARP